MAEQPIDPDVEYTKLREQVADLAGLVQGMTPAEGEGLQRIVGSWSRLDAWLTEGGHTPMEWAAKPHRHGWELEQQDAATWIIRLNGKVQTTVRYDGRGGGRWGMYTYDHGYEYHSQPEDAFAVLRARYEGRG